MNNKKRRCLAAALAVVLSSSTTLGAFAEDNRPSVYSAAETAAKPTEDSASVSAAPAESAAEVTEADNSANDGAAVKEGTLSAPADMASEEAFDPKKIATYQNSAAYFEFEDFTDAKGNPIEGKENECKVVLTGNLDLTRYDTIKFPEVSPEGKDVTVIGRCKGLGNYRQLKRVMIPFTVTEIAPHAFSGSSNTDATAPGMKDNHFDALSTVEFYGASGMTSALKTIGNYAFAGSKSLANINFPDSLEEIGKGAFSECIGISTIRLSENVKTVSDEAFTKCTKLDSVEIKNGNIGMRAFKDCTSLLTADLSGNTNLGSNAFEGCTNLKTVKFPSTVNLRNYNPSTQKYTTATYVFSKCTSLVGLGTDSDCTSNIVKLPANITEIPDYTFQNCEGIKTIRFNNTLTKIGNNAFNGCKSLTSVPVLKYEVGTNAFYGCKALKTITVTGGSLGASSFANSDLSTNVKLSGCQLGNSVFQNSGVIKVEFNSDVTFGIENSAGTGTNVFSNCKALTTLGTSDNMVNGTIALPDTVIEIPNNTFQNCEAITNVKFSNSLSSIGTSAFDGCTGLTSVKIPSGQFGKNVFARCTSLVSVQIGDGVGLDGGAFMGCESLANFGPITSGTMPAGVDLRNISSVPSDTFNGCKSIKKVTFPSDVCILSDRAFMSCTGIEKITLPATSDIYGQVFFGCTGLKTAQLKTAIMQGKGAFQNCKALETVQINSDSVLIGDSLFEGCELLTTFAEDVTANKGKVVMFRNAGNWTSTDPVVKDMVFNDVVPNRIFLGCKSITSVKLSDTLEAIGGNAFQNCTSLAAITLPQTLQCTTGYAFAGCTSLKQVTIPKNVMHLGENTFAGCTSLKNVTYKTILMTDISASCFYGCTSLSNIVIPDSIVSIKDRAFSNCTSLPTIDFEKGKLTTIGAEAFSGCTSLDAVYIPYSINLIDRSAFQKCTGLTSVVVDTNAKIGNNVFTDCTNLEEAVIFASTIGKNAFTRCTALKSVYLSDGVGSIDTNAFENCTSLETIELPEYLVSLSNQLFKGCKALKNVVIQNNVTNIGTDVFKDCPDNMKITYKGTEAKWKAIPNSTSLSSYAKVWNPNYIRKPASVVNFKAAGDKAGNKIKLTWLKNPCADKGYNIYQLKNGSWTKIAAISSKDTTAYTVSGYNTAIDNAFRIYAVDEKGTISKATGTAIMLPIKNFKATSVGTSVKLTWTKNSVAEGYNIWQSNDNVTWNRLGTVKTTSYTINNLSKGKKQYYRVTAYFGKSLSAIAATNVVVGSTPSKVTGFSGTSTANSVTLKWNLKTGATHYKVWMNVNGSWQLVTTTKDVNVLTCTKKSLKANTSYKFLIRAYNGTNMSEPAYITVKTKAVAPAAVTGFKGTSTTNSVTLSWTQRSGATKYKVWMLVNNNWQLVTETKNATTVKCTKTGLKNNTSYKFLIRAYNGTAMGAPAYVTVKTKAVAPAAVTGFKGTSTTNSVTLNWTKRSGATKYKVWMLVNNNWQLVTETKNATTVKCTKTGLKNNTSYKFLIRAYNGTAMGAPAYVTVKTKAVAPAAVTGFKGTSTTNSVTLSWTRRSGATKYKVWMLVNNKWQLVTETKNATTVKCTKTGLKRGTSYKFLIRAYNGTAMGAPAYVTVKTAK